MPPSHIENHPDIIVVPKRGRVEPTTSDARAVSRVFQTNGQHRTHVDTTIKNVDSSGSIITTVRDAIFGRRNKLISEFDQVDEETLDNSSIDNFLDFVTRERLSSMPHRGSLWDRVLRWAEFYALQIAAYSSQIDHFVPEAQNAANQIFVCLMMLLELGESNASALATTFAVFYKLGLSLSFLLSFETTLNSASHVRKDVGNAFNDIHTLVFDVASYYHRTVQSISRGTVAIDFNSLFSTNLSNFYQRKTRIVEHMWSHSLGGVDAVQEVRRIHGWLNSRQRVLKTISNDEHVFRSLYDEYTCEWVQRHLLDFTRDHEHDVLAITAPAGSGKSVLGSWIVERFQRPIDRNKIYTPIHFKFESDIPSETTSLALAKSLAFQLLELEVGNAAMFRKLEEAYQQKDHLALENRLWDAISSGFVQESKHAELHERRMIVIDGLDQVKGGDISGVRNRITKLCHDHSHTLKAIVLTKPSQQLHADKKWKCFEIKPDHVREDIRHVATHALQNYDYFRSHKDSDRHGIIDHITKTANGSFLWTILTTNLLRTAKSQDDFNKAVHHVQDTPALDQVIQNLIGKIAFSEKDTKTLLSLLLVTERPLTVKEVKALLELDIQRKTLVERKISIRELVAGIGGSPLILEGEVIKFRHNAVRAQLLSVSHEGKRLWSPKDAQNELVLRSLIYSKLALPERHNVSFEPLTQDEVDHCFLRHPFLEYSITYWPTHFHLSPLYKSAGELELSMDIKSVFPSSPHVALLEWSCWAEQESPHHRISLHDTALRVRSEVFTDRHECTLQNVIICANVHSEPISRARLYFRASQIGQTILDKYSSVTIQATQTFLSITENQTYNTRTEMVTYREEMIKFIVVVYKHQHGEQSDLVIRYLKRLAELYVAVHEESKATVIWKEIRSNATVKHGKGLKEGPKNSDELMINLKGNNDFKIEQYNADIFGITKETTVVWDLNRITIFLQMAATYEEKNEYHEAEEIYVTLWSRLLDMHRHKYQHTEIDFRVIILKVTAEYTRFLHRRKRIEEARNVLIVIWSEYEKESHDSVEFYQQFRIMADMMKSFGLLALSISAFNKISDWYKATGKYEHEDARYCRAVVLKSIEEITTAMSSSSSYSTIDVETIVRRMGSSTVVTKESIQFMRSQVNIYIVKEQYCEAISVLTKSLSLLWNFSATFQGSISLPDEFADEAIEFAILLGTCHSRTKHYHECLSIYLQLWHAVRASCKFEDQRRARVIKLLVAFYTEHKRWRLLIELEQELLVEYRRYLGPAHPNTITTLYLLAALCLEHGHGSASEYYGEIVVVIGTTDIKVSFEAYKILSRLYYEECRWLELKDVCDVLWETFVHHHKEHNFDAEFVELLYTRYIYVLQHHHKAQHKMIVSIAQQYKDTCALIFTATSAIAIRAMIEQASILMLRDETKSQAVSVYEEIVTTTRSTKNVISESSLVAIKKNMTEAYVSLVAHGSSSAASIQRAITVMQERFGMMKATLGVSHRETLTVFAEMISTIFRSKTSECTTIITQKLRETITEITTVEQSSEKLHEAASVIGSLYVMSMTQQQGLDLAHEIRRHVTGFHASQKKEFRSVTRNSFVFLVVLELTIRGSVGVTYSDIMTDLLTESVLYETYSRSLTSETKIDVLLARAAHLRAYWASHDRKHDTLHIEQQVLEIFNRQYSGILKTKETTKTFLIALLAYLGSKETTDVRIDRVAIIAGDNKVKELIKTSKFAEAHDVARCTFQFVKNRGAYHKAENIGYGFNLAGYMTGRSSEHSAPQPFMTQVPTELHAEMLKTSREIMTEVLHACRELKISFLSLHDHELNDLVQLLGEQENYSELDSILESLWKNRHGKKHWSQETIINLGKRLIETRQLASSGRAIHLAEDITYNLRRVLGGLNQHTLEMSNLLSQLYTSAGRHSDAMSVHEEIVELIVSGDDGNDRTDDHVQANTASEQVKLLHASWVRNDGFTKSTSHYQNLIDSLLSMREYQNTKEFQSLISVDKWKKDHLTEDIGVFRKPSSWSFVARSDELVSENGDEVKGLRSPVSPSGTGWAGSSLRRISANWGMKSMFGVNGQRQQQAIR